MLELLLPPPELRLEPEEPLPIPPPLLEGLLEPGIVDGTVVPNELPLSFTCSTTRLITVRTGGLLAAAGALTAAGGRVATAARRTTFLVFLRAAVFLPPFRPAAARRAGFALRDFAAFFPAVLRDEDFDEDLFFDDFFDDLLRDAAFFDDFFEERFFAAMGHSPF